MPVTLEELEIKFSAEMGGLNSQLTGIKGQLAGIGGTSKTTTGALGGLAKMGRVLAGAAIGAQIIKVGKESLQMANDAVESENLFEIAMGDMAATTRTWSDELSKSLGLNAVEVRKNVGTFNVMFKSMGLGSAQAQEMSTSMTALAQDMASFYNLSPEEAFTKLSAGITGETEPLKRLGILIDDNTISQYAFKKGISETGKNLTQQQKLLARYGSIMEQTSMAQGDLARTAESPTNQLRRMSAQVDAAKIALGTALQPALLAIIPVLTQMAVGAGNIVKALSGMGSDTISIFDDVTIKLDEATKIVSGIVDTSLTDVVKKINDLSDKTDDALENYASAEQVTKRLAVKISIDPPTITGEERIKTAISDLEETVKGYTSTIEKVVTASLVVALKTGEITQAQYDTKIGQLQARLLELNSKTTKFAVDTEALINTVLKDGTVTQDEQKSVKKKIETEASKLIKAVEKSLKTETAKVNALLKAGDIDKESAETAKAGLKAAAEEAIGIITGIKVSALAEVGMINWQERTFTAKERDAIIATVEAGIAAGDTLLIAAEAEVKATFTNAGEIGDAVFAVFDGAKEKAQLATDQIRGILDNWLDGAEMTTEDWNKVQKLRQERAEAIQLITEGITTKGKINMALFGLGDNLNPESIKNFFTAFSAAVTEETNSAKAILDQQLGYLFSMKGAPELTSELAAMGLTFEQAVQKLKDDMAAALSASSSNTVMQAARALGPAIAAAIESGDPNRLMLAALDVKSFIDGVDFSGLSDEAKASVLEMIDAFSGQLDGELDAVIIQELAAVKASVLAANPRIVAAFGDMAEAAMEALAGGLLAGELTQAEYDELLGASKSKQTLAALAVKWSKGGHENALAYVNALLAYQNDAELAGEALAQAAKDGTTGADTYSSGANFAQGFINGIKGKHEAARIAAQGLADVAWNALRNRNLERSPAKRPMKSGEYFAEGFAIGISNEANLAVRAAANLGNGAMGALDGINVPTPNIGRRLVGSDQTQSTALVKQAVEGIMANLVVNLTIDGERLGRASIKAINAVQQRSGRTILSVKQ